MTDSRHAVRTEIAAAAVLVAAGLFALLWLVPNHTQPAMSENDISPAFFPALSAMTVIALALGMIVVRLTRAVATAVSLSGPGIMLELAVWTAAALAMFLALPVIGFVPTTVIVIVLGAWAIGFRRWLFITLFAIGFAVIVDLGVWQIFTVDLP